MTKADDRRALQRAALIETAERIIAAEGLSGLKARDLATAVGCSLGGLYNLVGDLDELILRVAARTLQRLDEALAEAAQGSGAPPSPAGRLCAIALAYCRFARDNLRLWRALFDHRMTGGSILPEWQAAEQICAFAHIIEPLGQLLPGMPKADLELLGRTLFSAVHGIIAIGLDEKFLAVPIDALEAQIATLVRAVCRGLAAEAE